MYTSAGADTNMLTHSMPNSGLPVPNKIKTDVGFVILIDDLPICGFRKDEIICSRPIDMDLHLTNSVKSPVNKFCALNNSYVDLIKYKTATGNIPNTVIKDHILFAFQAA